MVDGLEKSKSEKWRRKYMTLLMRDKEQQKLGKYAAMVSIIRNRDDGVSDATLLKMLRIDKGVFDRILTLIVEKPEWDDEEIADAVIAEEE